VWCYNGTQNKQESLKHNVPHDEIKVCKCVFYEAESSVNAVTYAMVWKTGKPGFYLVWKTGKPGFYLVWKTGKPGFYLVWKTGKPGFYLQKGRSFQTGSGALLGFLFRLVPKAKRPWSCTSTRIFRLVPKAKRPWSCTSTRIFRLVPKAKRPWSCTSTWIFGSSNNSLTPLPQIRGIAYVVFSPKSVQVSGLSHACYMSCKLLTPCFYHLI